MNCFLNAPALFFIIAHQVVRDLVRFVSTLCYYFCNIDGYLGIWVFLDN